MSNIMKEYVREMERETLIRWFRVGETVERAIMTFPDIPPEEIQEICDLVKENPNSESAVATYYEIDSLDLPTKIRNICINHGIVTIKQLQTACDNGTLANFRGIGVASLHIVQCKLANPDSPLPQHYEVSLAHIHQLQSLQKRAQQEQDYNSIIALQWAISKLHALRHK